MYAWFRKNINPKERGFTLIELVVVLAIIGILIAAAVPLYLGARKKAYKAEANNALQELKTMEWAYYQQYGGFPPITVASLTPGTPDPSTGYAAPNSAFWTYGYAGTASNVTMSAVGKTGTPVAGASILLILSSDGSSSTSATF